MDAKSRSTDSGQALIEFLMFLPFMVLLYGIILTISNSINGSINQQKVTRGYFYYRLKNNSQVTKPYRVDGGVIYPLQFQLYGHYFLGWADFVESNQPVAPCYKVNLPLFGSNASDVCADSYSQASTQNIRIGSVYGICGVTFFNINGYLMPGPIDGDSSQVADSLRTVVSPTGCFIQK